MKLNGKLVKKNLGCKIGVTNSINWFFSNVKEGIILEDDIIAHDDFFNTVKFFLKNIGMTKEFGVLVVAIIKTILKGDRDHTILAKFH